MLSWLQCACGGQASGSGSEGQGRLAHTDTCRHACPSHQQARMLAHYTASIRHKQLHIIVDAS